MPKKAKGLRKGDIFGSEQLSFIPFSIMVKKEVTEDSRSALHNGLQNTWFMLNNSLLRTNPTPRGVLPVWSQEVKLGMRILHKWFFYRLVNSIFNIV